VPHGNGRRRPENLKKAITFDYKLSFEHGYSRRKALKEKN
jgi:hypothetical protein